jgi:hypothetical protein
VVATARLGARLVDGRKDGYPLPVLARVGWDRHRDTADLVNLTGRYALVSPDRQAGQIRRRAAGAAAIGLGFALLAAGCLAWLGGALDLSGDPGSSLLPFAELALVAGPAALLLLGSLLLEALDPGHRLGRRLRGPEVQPLRADVRAAWLAGVGVAAPADRWSIGLVRGASVGAVLAGGLALAVAAYGLIAVFGASARFAGERIRAAEWLERFSAAPPDSLPPPLPPRVALGLAASIPIEPGIARILQDGRVGPEGRRLLVDAIGPAFCLNPREVLFGISRERVLEREGTLLVAGPNVGAAPFDPAPLAGGGVFGLRRRARYCERYFGDPAIISPPFER